MAKIGRNDRCPCQSGKKYKHCCARKAAQPRPLSPAAAARVTLLSKVAEIQEQAVARRETTLEIGVFLLYATATGDAWLLEMTDQDCVQLAAAGTALAPPITENPETIEVNWSHTFSVRNRQLELTAYSDRSVSILADAPSQQINAMLRRIHRKFSREQLQRVHVETPPASGDAG